MEENTNEKQGFFVRLKNGLSKTRDGFVKNMDYVFNNFTEVDDEFYEELEEILITGDIGVRTTEKILRYVEKQVFIQDIKKPAECRELVKKSIMEHMDLGEAPYAYEEKKSVVFVVGVNGVGKTTTIGKLASKLKNDLGKNVIVAGADTFRAAAGGQLEEWTRRAGVDFISAPEGSDPASVVYDAVSASKSREADILMVDTAGRLHNKKNLMNELEKMNRIIDRDFPEAFRETLIVLDATTGQNALNQAREFSEVCDVTGVVLTKMDGTAKGGIAIAVQSELKIPVKYIGVGESIDALQKFDAKNFVDALFDK